MKIHGPSVGIGAGMTAATIFLTIFVLGIFDSQPELIMSEITSPPSEQSPITLATFIENSSPILGSSTAPLTLIEFGDYQCFFCNKFFHETEPSILENYVDTGKVKIIFKDFTIIGPDSINAANASHCAEDQEKFWEYHDILYDNWNGENNGWASLDNLEKFAEQLDLNMEEFQICMSTEKFRAQILSSNNDARSLEITGTPAFFLIDSENKISKIQGAQPYESFVKIFDSKLTK